MSTRDLPRLRKFYQGPLGFAQTYQFPSDGPPQYVGLRLGASYPLAALDT